MSARDEWTRLDAATLRGWPLPALAREADKEVRGRVLVVAGSREIPGAAVLASTAALRAGAGKLVIATAQSVSVQMAFAVPEARVIALPETARGAFAGEGLALLHDAAKAADAALIGSGLMDEEACAQFVAALLPQLAHAPLVLDALAMNVLRDSGALKQPLLFTPHAGEMAHLLGRSKQDVLADPQQAALSAAQRWNGVVALKGAITLIAAPSGKRWRHEGGQPGLATSGSGDVLAGIIAGLLAQGASLEQACAWGVVLHASAGAGLAARLGPLGYLARELPAEIPALVKKLQRRARVSPREGEPKE
jgi:ADP-dependent NAD(P)H-hydrate dehydratase